MMTMRGALLAGTAMVSLFAADGARAQLAVFDGANFGNTARSVVQGAQQLQQLAQQLQTMQQQLTAARDTFGSLSHAPVAGLRSFSGNFNVPALRDILPDNPDTLGNVVNGSGIGSMGPLGQEYANQNRVYQPQADDYAARQMTTNANSIAGVEALANQLFFSSSQHIAAIQTLEYELTNAPDEKTTADIQARVATEQTYLAAQQVQAQSIQTWQQAQVRNVDEQAAEQNRQNIDDVLSEDAAASSAPGN